MWGEKPALLHHTPPDYPAAFSRGTPAAEAPTALLCFPALIKCILAASLRAPWSRMAAPRPSAMPGQRKPLLPRSCRAIHPGVLSPATPAWGLSANVLLLLHFPAPSTTSGTVLEEKQRSVAPWLSSPWLSSGSTEGAFALCHTPHSSVPSYQHIHSCPAAPGTSSLPHHPLPRAPAQLGDSHPAAPGFVLALCPAVATYLVSWDAAAHGCRRHRLC